MRSGYDWLVCCHGIGISRRLHGFGELASLKEETERTSVLLLARMHELRETNLVKILDRRQLLPIGLRQPEQRLSDREPGLESRQLVHKPSAASKDNPAIERCRSLGKPSNITLHSLSELSLCHGNRC